MQYTWDIKQLNVLPTYNGYSDVVYSIVWVLTGTDGEYLVTTEGAVLTKIDEISDFVNYKNLSKDQVLNWAFDLLGNDGKQAAKAKLLQIVDSLKNQANNDPQSLPLPWQKD